jgi:hypothetical protein
MGFPQLLVVGRVEAALNITDDLAHPLMPFTPEGLGAGRDRLR